jgi:NADH-quinone oxidoreductase subunit A
MISGYILILAFFSGALVFVAVGFGLSRLLQSQKPNSQKISPYECGEESMPMEKTSFHFRYYLPAIIFLLFEVEIVVMAPVLLAQTEIPENFNQNGWQFLLKTESILFLVILVTGYALALSLKYLDWDKPEIKPIVFEGPIPDFAYEQFNIEQEKKWAER